MIISSIQFLIKKNYKNASVYQQQHIKLCSMAVKKHVCLYSEVLLRTNKHFK